ncbi:peptidoglycan-binding protein [Lentilactobacillus curieae]|uniref:Peptidoglycan-binding protein n=1 Tax=Lentilactobacillus curieae TaxID=1138822 RepID=A0A1S6QIP7_9LACO|nr:LysM peptidoglycan-binding domain-containing protein [Lentilactobacillus curieae]AQW21480.1 peptidoglycan-binding protein [Lentilactobacillus curieae]
MKKLVTTILATTAAALGLFLAGSTSADASTNYTVKSGDSVWAISQQFGSTIDAIENANSIQNHLILPGQTLVIPDGTTTVATAQPAAQQTTQSYNQQAATQTYSQPAASTQTASNNQTSSYNQNASYNKSANTNSQAASTSSNSGSSYTGGNSTKSYVLSQMASRTGVSASTWNYIINRESNWQPTVRNSSSGAYGLFQNMHISGGSVQDQVNAAVSLYKQQGMGAWSM